VSGYWLAVNIAIRAATLEGSRLSHIASKG